MMTVWLMRYSKRLKKMVKLKKAVETKPGEFVAKLTPEMMRKYPVIEPHIITDSTAFPSASITVVVDHGKVKLK